MICFEVHLNNERLCTAGVGDSGSLSTILMWTTSPERAGETNEPARADLHVGGRLGVKTVSWVEAFRGIGVGDSLIVSIVEREVADPPRRIEVVKTSTGHSKKIGPPQVGPQCSFCGKYRAEVRALVAGPTVYICDACVVLVLDMMRDQGVDPSRFE